MRMKTLCGALALLALPAGAALAEGPSAQALAYTCAGCHGTDGASVGPSSPHIAGMNAEYFVDSMKAYKADGRNATIMNRIAKGYSDEQIAGMAEFFAKQKPVLLAQQHDAAKAKTGAKLHEKLCEKCHEEGGRTASDGGTLAGQWMPYLAFSMADFQEGHREMPKKMKKKVDEAAKEPGALEALLHYYASQH